MQLMLLGAQGFRLKDWIAGALQGRPCKLREQPQTGSPHTHSWGMSHEGSATLPVRGPPGLVAHRR